MAGFDLGISSQPTVPYPQPQMTSKEYPPFCSHDFDTNGCPLASVTRLGEFLHFGQPLKASGNNYFTQIAYIVSNFCKGLEIIHFSCEIIFGQLL